MNYGVTIMIKWLKIAGLGEQRLKHAACKSRSRNNARNARFSGHRQLVDASLALAVCLALGLSLLLTGCGADVESQEAVLDNGVQTVTTELEPGSYAPITVQMGVPVRWTIHADERAINGCNNAIAIPSYGITINLQPGDNLVEFIPDKTGEIPFSCWMGMIRSSITVVDEL
jgi:plastocyanin domain-containing protein